MIDKHLPLAIAILLLAINVTLTADFLQRMRRIIADQEGATVTLPPAKGEVPAPGTLIFTLANGGIAYIDGMPLAESSLDQFLAANAKRAAVVQIQRKVTYAQTRAFLAKLQDFSLRPTVKVIGGESPAPGQQ
jgi:hypothetical protein